MKKIDIAVDKDDLRCLIKILLENGKLNEWEYETAMDALGHGR